MDGKTSAFGPFVIDRARRTVARNGEPVPVGHRGYALLETLLDAAGEPVSKEALMERAWPGTAVEEGNLSVQISALRRQLGDGAEAIIVTVPRVGYRLVAPAGRVGAAPGGPPLIAVLPFANHGEVAEDQYFADGVADDVTTALSRFKTFAVVSRSAAFALRDRGADARTAAAELGVRYALEGSIRRRDGLLRVTAQLIDAASGAHLWAERYEGSAADVFAFEDRITESVVGVIEPEIRKAEIERARRKPAASLDAYDLFLRALPLVNAPGAEGHDEALGLLDRAVALDPGFALAHACAALLHEKRISLRQRQLGEDDRGRAIAFARAALASGGGDDPLVRGICGFVLYRLTDDPSALEGLRGAVAENPNNVVILQLAGAGNRRSGAIDEAYRCYARAYELSPGAPEAYQSLHGMGAMEMIRGNHERAIEWCLKSLATFNDWVFTYATLATSYGALGRMDEAGAMVRRIQDLRPDLTIALIADGAAATDPFARAVIPGLRMAGLPER